MSESILKAFGELFAALGFSAERSAAELTSVKKMIAAKLLAAVQGELPPEQRAFIARGEHLRADPTNPTMQTIRAALKELRTPEEWETMRDQVAREVAGEYVACVSKGRSADAAYRLEEILARRFSDGNVA